MIVQIVDTITKPILAVTEKRLDADTLNDMLTVRKPSFSYFEDDGVTPNHPKWPLIVYRKAITFKRGFDNGDVLDQLFQNNGWGQSWRASIYDFLHYHSEIHEVLGVARGHASIQFGGLKGKVLKLNVGDVVVLPAGTGHQRISSTSNFQVVGAYPPEGRYNERTDTRDRFKVKGDIAKTKKPMTDPVYGKTGALLSVWGRRTKR